MATLGLEEFLETIGVRLERTPVGDRNVAERMRELGAVLGGEPAGHIVLPHGTAAGRVPLIGDVSSSAPNRDSYSSTHFVRSLSW